MAEATACGKWRQQLRLTHAALESGYSTPSAFISMFHKTLGTTPALYVRPPGRT